MDRVVLPVVRAWRPDAIVAQCGVDHHHADPLSHLLTTMPLYPELWDRLVGAGRRRLRRPRSWRSAAAADEPCMAPPRAWALLAARMAGVTVTDPVPESWRRIALDAGCPEPAHGWTEDRGPAPDPSATPGGRRGGRRDRPERRGPVALLPLGAPAGG